MRIRLETSDRLPFWIIGDPSHNERTEGSEALGESVQITRNQQTISGAEWEAKTFYDRGNQSVMVEATARREFADEWERHQFLEMLAPTDLTEELHRWEGDVWLRFPKADGTFNESKMPEAILALTGKQMDGAVGVRLTYRIQAAGFDIAAAQAGVEKVSLVADGIVVGPPVIDFFGTEVGGAAMDPDDAGTLWNSAVEGTGVWMLWISARVIVNDESVTYNCKLCFGGAASGYTLIGAAPLKDHLAAIGAALDATWISHEVLTVGGRSCLRLTMDRESEAEGAGGLLPELKIRVDMIQGGISSLVATVTVNDSRPTVEDVLLMDAGGVHLIADRITS